MKIRHMLVLIAVIICSATLTASAQVVPELINYQGKLMDGTNLVNGDINISFRLYDAPTGGAFPYCEDSGTVSVVDGVYSAFIGDDVVWGSLDNALIQTQVWIEVVIDGTNIMSPREQLVSVGYARYAAGLPANAVKSHMIDSGQIYNYHIHGGEITGDKIGSGTISNANLATGSVTSDTLEDGTIAAVDVDTASFSNTFWKTDGNAGTVAGRDFIGTTDNQPLELYANGERILQLAPNTNSPSLIGGHANNNINAGAYGSVICGGGGSSIAEANAIAWSGTYGAIGGGYGNSVGNGTIQTRYSVIAGGCSNATYSNGTTIGGGKRNIARNLYATCAGGYLNKVHAYAGSIIGGYQNICTGSYAVVAGGNRNEAQAQNSFIGGGYRNLINEGSTNAAIAGGDHNVIEQLSPSSVIAGGEYNLIRTNASASAIVGGNSNTIDDNAYESIIGGGASNIVGSESDGCTIGGGRNNQVTFYNDYVTIPGGKDAKGDHYGQIAHASGCFSEAGDAQASEYVLRNLTTSDSVWEDLYLDGTNLYITVTNNEAIAFDALIIAQSDAGENAGYRIEGMFVGGSGSTIAYSSVNVLHEDDPVWNVRASGSLSGQNVFFEVLGNGENIRWVASVRTAEVQW